MKNYWIKLRHDTLSTPHLAQLRDRLWRRYIECMLFAGQNGQDGRLPTKQDMAWVLHCDAEQLETELTELAGVGLLSLVDGHYYVSGFEDTQLPSKHAQYMKEWREKKKVEKDTKNEKAQIEIKR